jgi:hypothetical protein
MLYELFTALKPVTGNISSDIYVIGLYSISGWNLNCTMRRTYVVFYNNNFHQRNFI